MNLPEHIGFYVFGVGGTFMFDHLLWAYAAVILAGLVFAGWRGDRFFLGRQVELLILAFLFWLIPTLSFVKTSFFAAAFGFMVAVLVVMALRSIYESMRGATGAIVLCVLGSLLLISSREMYDIPNTFSTVSNREFAMRAVDRLTSAIVGNATDSRAEKIYMTNIGAYAPNILQYYLLKRDPERDWIADSKWADAKADHHIDYIHKWRPDFVIADARDNGLTYSPFAWDAEDGVLAAMWQDPAYMAIDRFYGPSGGAITLFTRRVNFGGWRPVSGMVTSSRNPDEPRMSSGNVTYLQSFAARPVSADLQIESSGPAGGTVTVFVNQRNVGEITFLADKTFVSFTQAVYLTTGANDIVLQYSPNVQAVYRRLVIVPHIAAEG